MFGFLKKEDSDANSELSAVSKNIPHEIHFLWKSIQGDISVACSPLDEPLQVDTTLSYVFIDIWLQSDPLRGKLNKSRKILQLIVL